MALSQKNRDEIYESYREMDGMLRRVLANTSVPQSATELTRLLTADTQSGFGRVATEGLSVADEIKSRLETLARMGLVKNIGPGHAHAADPNSLVQLVAGDVEVPDIPPIKAEALVGSLRERKAHRLQEGDLWYWTENGQAALGGAQYNPPREHLVELYGEKTVAEEEARLAEAS